MTEVFFVILMFFFLTATIAAWLLCWRCRIRLKHLQKLTRINVFKRQQFFDKHCLYSSAILNRVVKILFYDVRPRARQALTFLLAGRVQKAASYIAPQSILLSQLLTAHYNPQAVYNHMKSHKKLWRKNPQYAIYFPLLAHKLFATAEFSAEISRINAVELRKSAPENMPYYYFGQAVAHLQEGDMLSASQSASAALKNFQNLHYSPEEADCYLLLGEIYRLSCVNDVAQTMIETAAEIYRKQNLAYSYAQATAAMGMLMMFQNRITEARELYIKALHITKYPVLQADIYNQIALLELTENNLSAAKKAVTSAVHFHQDHHNIYGYAYSLQLIAHIAFTEKKYHRAGQYAHKAGALYRKCKNYSAYCECQYLQSNSLYKLQKYIKSEPLLRDLLSVAKFHPNSFHISTAYSLLALIYLKTGDLHRAKALLMQSIALEQQNNRCTGLAADYTNLAVIAQISEQPDEAAKNLMAAAEYAQKSGNTELISLIENKLKNPT